jgi:uncharacterized membrane protein YgcG
MTAFCVCDGRREARVSGACARRALAADSRGADGGSGACARARRTRLVAGGLRVCSAGEYGAARRGAGVVFTRGVCAVWCTCGSGERHETCMSNAAMRPNRCARAPACRTRWVPPNAHCAAAAVHLPAPSAAAAPAPMRTCARQTAAVKQLRRCMHAWARVATHWPGCCRASASATAATAVTGSPPHRLSSCTNAAVKSGVAETAAARVAVGSAKRSAAPADGAGGGADGAGAAGGGGGDGGAGGSSAAGGASSGGGASGVSAGASPPSIPLARACEMASALTVPAKFSPPASAAASSAAAALQPCRSGGAPTMARRGTQAWRWTPAKTWSATWTCVAMRTCVQRLLCSDSPRAAAARYCAHGGAAAAAAWLCCAWLAGEHVAH